MKKHVFGAALFAAIVGFFALAFAIVRLEILPLPPVAEGSGTAVSVSVISAYYDADSGKIVTDAELVWRGPGAAPESLSLERVLSFTGENSTLTRAERDDRSGVFSVSNRVRVRFESRAIDDFGDDTNLYAKLIVRNGNGIDLGRSSATPVLTIHGDRSRPRR